MQMEGCSETLAKLHRVIPKSVGLEGFGKPSGFYDRQIATFTTVSKSQAQAVDVETKEPVGKLPHFAEMIRFFANKATQPQDRGTLVHGDYKIDNIVFHKTEPRVIGILDWEMGNCRTPVVGLLQSHESVFPGWDRLQGRLIFIQRDPGLAHP